MVLESSTGTQLILLNQKFLLEVNFRRQSPTWTLILSNFYSLAVINSVEDRTIVLVDSVLTV